MLNQKATHACGSITFSDGDIRRGHRALVAAFRACCGVSHTQQQSLNSVRVSEGEWGKVWVCTRQERDEGGRWELSLWDLRNKSVVRDACNRNGNSATSRLTFGPVRHRRLRSRRQITVRLLVRLSSDTFQIFQIPSRQGY